MPRLTPIVFLWIGAGALSAVVAMLLALGSPGVLVLAYLAPLPVFLVGLAHGATASAVACLSGFALAGFAGGALAAGIYALVHGAPAWYVTRRMLSPAPAPAAGGAGPATADWPKPGPVIADLALFGAAVLGLAAIAAWSGGSGLRETVTEYLREVFSALVPTLRDPDLGQAVATVTPWLPGAVVGSWLVMVAANGALAQWLLVRLGRAQRPTPDYRRLALPDRLSFVIVAAAAAALLLPGDLRYTGRNLVLVLAVPFFLLGLAVVHTVVDRLPSGRVFLVATYFLMALSSLAMGIVAGVGLAEQWLGLRDRFAPPPGPPKE